MRSGTFGALRLRLLERREAQGEYYNNVLAIIEAMSVEEQAQETTAIVSKRRQEELARKSTVPLQTVAAFFVSLQAVNRTKSLMDDSAEEFI